MSAGTDSDSEWDALTENNVLKIEESPASARVLNKLRGCIESSSSPQSLAAD